MRRRACTELRVEEISRQSCGWRTPIGEASGTSFRLASENPAKVAIVKRLLAENPRDPTLVIGQYLDQLAVIARDLDLPIITGQTPTREREQLFEAFREGEVRVLVVSKVVYRGQDASGRHRHPLENESAWPSGSAVVKASSKKS